MPRKLTVKLHEVSRVSKEKPAETEEDASPAKKPAEETKPGELVHVIITHTYVCFRNLLLILCLCV